MLNLALILILVSILVLLLIVKPRSVFLLILSSLILFYKPISQDTVLLTIGGAKVYPGDLIAASISAFLIFRIPQKRFLFRPRSVILFSLLFMWGLLAIARGIPLYGYSAVGESRWYILPMLYYFFILVTFKDEQQIRRLAEWFLYLTVFMVPFHYVDFYFLGKKERMLPLLLEDPRFEFRFINATEGLLAAFALISLLLFYLFGEIKRRTIAFYGVLGILSLSLIVAQIRSVWLAAITGLVMLGIRIVHRFIQGRVAQQVLSLISALSIVAILSLFLVNQANSNLYAVLLKSASFFQNPREDPTGSWRLIGWQQELERSMKNSLLGQGLGGYSEWFDGQQWQRVAVHNGYIMFFSKFGIIGLFLVFFGLFSWYLEMLKYTRIERERYYKLLSHALQICVLMHLIFALFYDFTIFFWMLLAIGTVLVRKRASKEVYKNLL
ncbi:MAG: hypothetical protein QXO20_07145 [Candidatus Bathyarchaeia archaeon]